MSGAVSKAVAAAILVASFAVPALADDPATAPADAWPMARGCLAGTGVSAAVLRLPLAEAWHRQFDGTAFGVVPVIADGVVYVGDLDAASISPRASSSGSTRSPTRSAARRPSRGRARGTASSLPAATAGST